MTLLAIDTTANLCAACLLDDGGRETGRCVRDIGTGHAEALMPVIAEALRQAGIGYAGIERVAVAVGPGSFTGIRVGVATARGLALARSVPATGVGTLEAIAAEAAGDGRAVLAVLPSGRELAAALYDADGAERAAPRLMTAAEAAALAREHRAVLAGAGADAVAAVLGGSVAPVSRAATADIATFARLALRADRRPLPPKPLYLRKPDAKPQSGFALPRKGA